MSINPGLMFAVVLAVEALFSVVDLSTIPGVVRLTEHVSVVIPVVGNFMANPAANANAAPFIALTCLSMPLKVYAAFVKILQLSPKDKALVVCFPSSEATLSRKIISSILVFLLNIGLVWYVFSLYGESSYFGSSDIPQSAITKYRLISANGIEMWLGWSVMHLVVMSFLIGLLSVFVFEWLHALLNLIKNEE